VNPSGSPERQRSTPAFLVASGIFLSRIAGLIHVSDGESGAARKRVLERLGRT